MNTKDRIKECLDEMTYADYAVDYDAEKRIESLIHEEMKAFAEWLFKNKYYHLAEDNYYRKYGNFIDAFTTSQLLDKFNSER